MNEGYFQDLAWASIKSLGIKGYVVDERKILRAVFKQVAKDAVDEERKQLAIESRSLRRVLQEMTGKDLGFRSKRDGIETGKLK